MQRSNVTAYCCAEDCAALKREKHEVAAQDAMKEARTPNDGAKPQECCTPNQRLTQASVALQRIKALKKGAKREKREAAARDAMKEAQAAMPSSPRQVANRMRGDRGTTPMRTWQVSTSLLAARHSNSLEQPCEGAACPNWAPSTDSVV